MTSIHNVPYPFVKEKMEIPRDDPEGTKAAYEIGWRPGVTIEHGDYGRLEGAGADAMGTMVIEELSRHKPSEKHHERVFFLRQFRDPDGNMVGKKKMMITTAGAFARLLKGYRYPFDLA